LGKDLGKEMIETKASATFEVVFTATFPGIYQFVEHGPGDWHEFLLSTTDLEGPVNRDIDTTDQASGFQETFTIYLNIHDKILHRGGTSKLSGVRLGDEL
jgi:hypothetical protein